LERPGRLRQPLECYRPLHRQEISGAASAAVWRTRIAHGIRPGIQHGYGAARMALSVVLYFALLALVAVGRIVELRRSRRNQQRLRREGSTKAEEPGYRLMVA